MTFLVDGVPVGSLLTSNIALDAYIKGITNVPAGGGSVVSSGNGNAYGVDLLTGTTDPAWGLALQIDKFSLFYTGNKVAMAAAGQSTSIWAQSLPFGLAFDPSQPISVVFSSANLTNVTTSGDFLKGFDAAGTGNISGTLAPEPCTLVLLTLGGLLLGRRRIQ